MEIKRNCNYCKFKLDENFGYDNLRCIEKHSLKYNINSKKMYSITFCNIKNKDGKCKYYKPKYFKKYEKPSILTRIFYWFYK